MHKWMPGEAEFIGPIYPLDLRTISEAASLTHIRRETLYRWVHHGVSGQKLYAHRSADGRHIFVSLAEIKRLQTVVGTHRSAIGALDHQIRFNGNTAVLFNQWWDYVRQDKRRPTMYGTKRNSRVHAIHLALVTALKAVGIEPKLGRKN